MREGPSHAPLAAIPDEGADVKNEFFQDAETSPETGPQEKVPGIHRKTDEELRIQYNLAYQTVLSYIPSLPENLRDVELSDIGETIEAIQSKPSSERSIEDQRILAGWRDYVSKVRNLRAFQAEQIQDARLSAPIEKRRETYLKAISWSGEVHKKILGQIQSFSEIGPTGGRYFTDAALAEAARTEQGFLDQIDEIAEIMPENLAVIATSLQDILPRRRVLDIFDRVLEKKPSTLASFPSGFLKLYGPETFGEKFRNLIEADPSDSLLKSLNPEMIGIIGIEPIRKMLEKNIEEDPLGLVSSARFGMPAEFMFSQDSGLVDMRSLDESLMRCISEDTSSRIFVRVKIAWPHLSEQSRDACRARVRETLPQLDFSDLRQTEELIGKEELRALMKEKLLDGKDYIYLRKWEEAEELLGKEYPAWAAEVQEMKRRNISPSDGAWDDFFSNSEISFERKKKALDAIGASNPATLFYNHRIYLQFIPEEERGALMAQYIDQTDSETGLETVHMWLPALSEDPEQQKRILEEYIMGGKNLDFVRFLHRKYGKEKQHALVDSLFPPEEMKGLIIRKADISPGGCFNNISELREILGGDEKLREFIDQKRTAEHTSFIQNLSKFRYLYSNEELLGILKEPNDDSGFADALFDSAPIWAPLLSPDEAYELLARNAGKISMDAYGLKKALTHISLTPEQTHSLLEKVSSTNPCATVWVARDGVYEQLNYPIDLQDLKARAIERADTAYLPVTLSRLWKDIDPYGDLVAQSQNIRRGARLYDQISMVETHGLTGLQQHVFETSNIRGQESELRLLEVLTACAYMQSSGTIDRERLMSCSTTAEIESVMSDALESILGINSQENPAREVDPAQERQEMEQFISTMGTVSPFITYTSQHYRSIGHKAILKDMYTKIGSDAFYKWKYGGAEELDRFREKGWVPREITPEQYAAWQKDESSNFFDSLQVSANETAGSIQKIILENSEHLGSLNISEVMQENGVGAAEILAEIKTGLSTNGVEIGDIKKAIQQMKADGRAEGEEFETLLERKRSAEEKRKELGAYRDLTRLCMLSAKEVTLGYLLDGDKKVQRISRVLTDLKSSIPAEGAFVIERIEKTMGSLAASNTEKQNIITSDTGNPKVTLEIGENPVSSCQSYQSGQHNDCLLGYTDPNTKMITVTNEKGSIIARSVLRLLSNSKGQPELHVERVYSTSASATVSKVLFEHAMQKAELMGVPLRSSRGSLTAESGFKNDANETTSLRSLGSRAPKVYVDSAGGAKSYGKYTITDAQLVNRINGESRTN